MGTNCSYSGWLTNGAATCAVSEYVKGLDYAASQAMMWPPGGVDGRLRVNCCKATPPPAYSFEQESCTWASWADTPGDLETCAVGKYVAGLEYDDGATIGFLGKVRELCCFP